MRTRVVLGALLALTLIGVVAALSDSSTRLAGTNHVRTIDFTVEVPGGAEACQPATSLAADAGGARLLVGTHGGPTPPLAIRFADADGFVARGQVAGGLREGEVTVPFERAVEHQRTSVTACVRNDGRAPIVLGGDIATPANGARVDDGEVQGVVAFAYPRAEARSWWSLLPGVAERFGVGKAPILGTWTLPVAAVVLLGAWAAVIRLLLRELPR